MRDWLKNTLAIIVDLIFMYLLIIAFTDKIDSADEIALTALAVLAVGIGFLSAKITHLWR